MVASSLSKPVRDYLGSCEHLLASVPRHSSHRLIRRFTMRGMIAVCGALITVAVVAATVMAIILAPNILSGLVGKEVKTTCHSVAESFAGG